MACQGDKEGMEKRNHRGQHGTALLSLKEQRKEGDLIEARELARKEISLIKENFELLGCRKQ